MSAMGDRAPEFHLLGPASESASSSLGNTNEGEWGRIGNVSVPLAVLQALDDPLVGWRTVGTANPQGLADSGTGNVILLLTKAGGHVVRTFLFDHPKKSALANLHTPTYIPPSFFFFCVNKTTPLRIFPRCTKGWPLGNNPAKHSWKWMNDAARDFVAAVDIARRECVGP
jgi:hypothetical protein